VVLVLVTPFAFAFAFDLPFPAPAFDVFTAFCATVTFLQFVAVVVAFLGALPLVFEEAARPRPPFPLFLAVVGWFRELTFLSVKFSEVERAVGSLSGRHGI
jgi:hypothetical protein